MRFESDDILVRTNDAGTGGWLVVVGYEPNGGLQVHPQGGGPQYIVPQAAQCDYRVVEQSEMGSSLWQKSKFELEGCDQVFEGWTSGRRWNGWAMPYFELAEAKRLTEAIAENGVRYDAERDAFVSFGIDGDEEVWEGTVISTVGASSIKVYGVGAGAWIWEEIDTFHSSANQ